MNIKTRIIFAAFLAVFIIGCDEDTDFKGLYKPREIGDTRTFDCNDKPGTGTEWNTVSEYTQTWDGSSWLPADDDTTEYNEYGSTTTCQFKCAMQYMWDGYNCVQDTQNLYRTYYCQPKPDGEGYEWNIVSEYTQKSSDQGSSWYPSDDSTTEYNESPSTTSCQYKCASGYMWSGTECTSAPTDTRTFVCNPLPSNSGEYAWNTVDRYTQNSYDGGSTWVPADDTVTDYNETPSTTSCQFKCNTNYAWNGSACVNQQWDSYGGYQWLKSSGTMLYSEATSFCYNLGASIPSISQLRTLIQNCPDTVSTGGCAVTDSCTSWSSCRTANCASCTDQGNGYYSVFSDASWFWSGTQVSDQSAYMFTINYNTGSIDMSSADGSSYGNVRCIK